MESLRIMPPVPLTVRKATEAGWIDGIMIPKGTMFTIPVSSAANYMHHMVVFDLCAD